MLGLKGFAARKAVERAPAMGPDAIHSAIQLMAQADMDLRGQRELPEEAVLEVLVARLCRLSATRRQPEPALTALSGLSARAGGQPGERGSGLGGGGLHQPALAAGGLVLVDDALGRGLVEALLGQLQALASPSLRPGGARRRS